MFRCPEPFVTSARPQAIGGAPAHRQTAPGRPVRSRSSEKSGGARCGAGPVWSVCQAGLAGVARCALLDVAFEIRLVDPLDVESALRADTDAVLVHVPGKRLPVDQHDPARDPTNVVLRVGREVQRRDEDAFRGPLTFETPGECLQRGTSDGCLGPVALRLDVDRVEPEFVFVDPVVDPVVAALPGDPVPSLVNIPAEPGRVTSTSRLRCRPDRAPA